eukprot:3155622-Rhodomonas_salina.1
MANPQHSTTSASTGHRVATAYEIRFGSTGHGIGQLVPPRLRVLDPRFLSFPDLHTLSQYRTSRSTLVACES